MTESIPEDLYERAEFYRKEGNLGKMLECLNLALASDLDE